ncbi:MAG: ABC transporter permease [Bacillota bacterium]|nr:ABC transporter permease [Bacillota bacterium]
MKEFGMRVLELGKQAAKRTWLAIKSDKQLRFGVIGILVLLLIIVFADVIAKMDPNSFEFERLKAPGENGHLLGTNHMGQDVFAMLVHGVGTSLKVAVISSFISGALGVLIGGLAGFLGGKVDLVISELINVFLMIPTFFLILLIIALFGNNIVNVMIVIGITTWPSNAKLMRAQALSLRERVFVKSAIALGETQTQILFKYILPNGIFPVVANTTRGMAGAILTEAALSFLGLGDPNIISWGQMIYQGKAYITSAWWISAFSGLAIIMTVIIFYMLGDGLNHVLNPKYNYGRGK